MIAENGELVRATVAVGVSQIFKRFVPFATRLRLFG